METLEERIARKLPKKKKLIRVAMGEEAADLVVRNATYLNVFSSTWETGDIAISGGLIAGIGGEYHGITEIDTQGQYVTPGLIDAHIHLESSIVKPSEFARIALRHGTTTVVTDPHEITNVMGTDGIRYMLEATENIGVDVMFMLPSCVPATPMDENAMPLHYQDIDEFYSHPRVLGLAEMMNYVGVNAGDDEVLSKILAAQSHHKKIDGHAPQLSGRALDGYIAAGVYSDHECDTYENALEKLKKGQFVMIREGTAARNLDALMPLIRPELYSRCMFATDDKHPNDLLNIGHIDSIVRRCLAAGCDPILTLKTATHNAARYFLMNNKGAIAGGYVADLLILDDLSTFSISTVIKRGTVLHHVGNTMEVEITPPTVSPDLAARATDTMHCAPVNAERFACGRRPVIELTPGELYTGNGGYADAADPAHDLLKIAVIERHHNTGHIGLAYIRGYGLTKGAVATSIAHDSHNIIAVGASDEDIARAVNAVIAAHGGIYVTDGDETKGLPLPIAGLMSDGRMEDVNAALEGTKAFAYSLGVKKDVDPFMSLSFLSLPVIPALKLTPQGVFDVTKWAYLE